MGQNVPSFNSNVLQQKPSRKILLYTGASRENSNVTCADYLKHHLKSDAAL